MAFRGSILALTMLMICMPVGRADPFVDEIVDVQYGTGAGFGQDELPGIVLGPPEGGGEGAGSMDVLALGDGGSIVLAFRDNLVRNGPGTDLIVFENPFYAGGSPLNVYSEVAFVEVSQDGDTFFRFGNDYDPEGTPINNPVNWSGFAGVHPVLSNSGNGIDPTDPDVAGGDQFDLEELGLEWIRYVRIIDTNEPPNSAEDDDGDEIYDPGMPSGTTAGFDLDAIAAVYSEELHTPTPVQTPTPMVTATPTIDVTSTATPTSMPAGIMLDLQLSLEMFRSADQFILDLEITNYGSYSEEVIIALLLDVFGQYFFYPAWQDQFEAPGLQIDPGMNQIGIFDSTWPEIQGESKGLIFWCGLIDPQWLLMSNIDREEFGYTSY
jgi:hypothetical protein